MYVYGTIDHWWPESREFPFLRYLYKEGRKCVLKAVGYAHLIRQIRRAQPKTVLEFGHGTSSPLFDLFAGQTEMVGVDAYPGARPLFVRQLNEFRQRYPGARFLDARLGDGPLDLPSGGFDLVCSVSVVEHFEEVGMPEDQAFAEVYRLLRPGGLFVNAIDTYTRHRAHHRFADAMARTGFVWQDPNTRHMPVLDPDLVMFEEPRGVMEQYLVHLPPEKRVWPGNYVTILTAATKPL